MASTIQVRVDDDLKNDADKLFKDLGTDTTTAIRMFLTQAILNDGFPFEIRRRPVDPFDVLSEDEILEKLARSRTHAAQGRSRDAEAVISDKRAKYGL